MTDNFETVIVTDETEANAVAGASDQDSPTVDQLEQEGDLRVLSKPDTVNALQELTRLAVQNKTGSFSRLILDIGGSRDARQAELAALVGRAIERIESGAADAALPPMSSYERKLVHDIVSERGYVSESQGEGRDRHTVISAS